MPLPRCKIKFVITTMCHANGEIDMGDKDDHIFIHPIDVYPLVTIISEHELTEEETARVKLMALHQQMLHVLRKVTPTGMPMEEIADINMAPPTGERS